MQQVRYILTGFFFLLAVSYVLAFFCGLKLFSSTGLRSLNPRSGCGYPHSVCLYCGGKGVLNMGPKSCFPVLV